MVIATIAKKEAKMNQELQSQLTQLSERLTKVRGYL
jgi:hypothetical protein